MRDFALCAGNLDLCSRNFMWCWAGEPYLHLLRRQSGHLDGARLSRGPMFVAGVETTEFIPTDAGTTMVYYRFRLQDRGRVTRLRFRSTLPIFRRAFIRSHEKLEKTMHEDGCPEGTPSSAGVEEETPPASLVSS